MRSKSFRNSSLIVGMSTEPANELVTISVARLRELEALEASLAGNGNPTSQTKMNWSSPSLFLYNAVTNLDAVARQNSVT